MVAVCNYTMTVVERGRWRVLDDARQGADLQSSIVTLLRRYCLTTLPQAI